jgi:PKD repeat protein
VNITLTVNPEPVVSGTLNATVCSDASSGITLATNGTSVSAQNYTINSITPQSGLVAKVGNASIGANKTATAIVGDVFTNTTGGNLTVQYNVTPISSSNCAGDPLTIILTVLPEPVVSSTLNAAVCSDAPAGINFNTNGTSISAANYTINSVSVASGLTPASGNATTGVSKPASAIASDIFTNNTASILTVVYNITPVSAAGCLGDPKNITLTINPEPSANASLEQPVCSDVPFSFNPQNNITNAVTSNFTWTASYPSGLTGGAASGSGPVAGTLNNVTTLALNAVFTVTATSSSGTCVGNPFTITVPIRPEPVGSVDATIVCSDVAANYNLLNNVAILGNNVGSTFSWFATDNTSVTGESMSPQTGPIVTNILNNVTNLSQGVVYSITPTSAAGCVGNSFSITINVSPEPVGISSSNVICSDLSVAYDLQNNVNTSGNNLAANFGWSASTNGNVSGEGTLVKNASLIDDILINGTNSVQNVLYTINPTAQTTGCVGNTFTLSVDINPRAKLSAGPDLAVCEDKTDITLQGSINYAPNGILWTGGAGSYSSNTDINAKYAFAKPSEINTMFTLTVTALDPDGAGPCPQETDQMTLKVNPLPVVVFTGLPSGVPPQMAENNLPITLTGNQIGGVFTIAPITSNIGSTVPSPVDKAIFDPSAVTLGSNYITYTFINTNGCTNSNTQEVIVNPITNVDFTIQNATLNASSQYELCSELGLVKLIGFPAASTGLPPETQFTSIPAFPGGPTATIVFDGVDYFIQTTNLPSQLYRIRYDYKNAFGAITFRIRDVRILTSPIAALTSSNNCIASDVVFKDASTVNPTPFPTNIASWTWNFGDNSSSTTQNPSWRYSVSNTYYVTLKVTTLQGCSNTTAALANPIRVGDVPIPDFNWSSICNNDFTKFEDLSDAGKISTITGYSWDFGDGDVAVGATGNTITGGTNGGRTTGVFNMPDHKYINFGQYDAKLTVTTNDGCSSSLAKRVFIQPYKTVRSASDASYSEDFELTNGGWTAETLVRPNSTKTNILKNDTSWVWGIPVGYHLNGGSGSQKAWWTGHNKIGESTYFPNENSAVNGPCFDLSSLKRPMISLDYFADADVSDGAVLQYSIDGGNNWRIVGPNEALQDRDQGINWFNGSSIFSNPGNQFLGQYGWTGSATNTTPAQGQWKNARFNLDMVPVANRGQVRLRIAFASNDGNPAGTYDGFAFDNVFVGDKQRTVLVEHFTNNTYLPARIASQDIDDMYTNQVTVRLKPDFFKLQYHMAVPGVDPLNTDNPTDPGARAFYYQNVTQPPFTVMDGILGKFYNKTFQGGYKTINDIELDRRALEDPAFVIDTVEIDPNSPSNIIQAKVKFTYIEKVNPITTPVTFQVALVETDIATNKNVLKKLLLQSEGFTVNRAWKLNDQQTIDINYTLDVPVYDPSKLYLAVFVQDFASKRIHQAGIVKAPAKVGVPPVGIIDNPVTAEIWDISVYPNPASKVMNFYLENALTHDFSWEIVDQRGVTVMDGELNRDLSSPQQVEVKDIANGIYFVRFKLADKTLVYRKIAILKSN